MCYKEGDSKYNFTLREGTYSPTYSLTHLLTYSLTHLREGTTSEAFMDLKYVEFTYKEPLNPHQVIYKYEDVLNRTDIQQRIKEMAVTSKRQLCSEELHHNIERRICLD